MGVPMYARPNSRIRRVGLGQLTAVASAIETEEGYYPGSISYQDNNPGNLMAAGQPGCTATSAGFCSFATFADGWNALLNQISLDASRGETISQFIAKYAPASAGNDPTSYANYVASSVGLSPSDPLSLAISQTGSDASTGAGASSSLDLSSLDSSLSSILGGDSSTGVDLSSIGLGVVDPSVLIAAGLVLVILLILWERNR